MVLHTHTKRVLSLFGVIACCALLYGSPVAYAQDGIGVRLQPSTIEERADPGTSIEGVLTVTNQDGGRQMYYLATRNIENMDDSGRPVFSKFPPSDPLEAASWITIAVPSIDLDQGKSTDVPFRIDIPKDASPGSYFAAIFVSRDADRPTESGAGVGFQVASLVNLRVNGVAVEGVTIREFSTDRSFYTKPLVLIHSRLENTGTVHERPRGIIIITDMFGNKVEQITLNENAGGIMPHNDRTFENTWERNGFVFGRYRALASIVYGDTEKQTINREVTFWVIPLREVATVFGGIMVLALLVTWGMRAYVRRALRRAGHSVARSNGALATQSFAKRLMRTLVWLIALFALLFIGTLVFYA